MKPLKNDSFLKAIKKEKVDSTPMWIMRQAGRYLPEYLATREKAGSFMNLCKTPELACEVTLQPLRRYRLDAAILFSDILTIPDAMGLGLELIESKGPVFKKTVRTSHEIQNLHVPDPSSELRYVVDAVKLIKHELDQSVPLIGFSGSPFTLATYMVEGKPTKNFEEIKKMLYGEPANLHELLGILAISIEQYLLAQIEAGVDAVMVFDTWGGILTPEDYRHFSLNYMAKIVANIKKQKPDMPVILFTKGGTLWLEDIADTGCDCVGLDWNVNIKEARQRIGDRVALQGNLDPSILYAPADVVVERAKKLLDDYGHGSGHIFNLGHGVTPTVDPETVHALVETVKEYSKQKHQ